MSQDAIHKFIATVALHFPRPKFSDDETMEGAWMASMNRVLSGYSDEVLAEAAHRILRDRNPKKDGKFFPVPSECTEVCNEVARLEAQKQTPLLSYGHQDSSEFAGWRYTLADDLIKSELGKRAAREGWALMFHTFCRTKGRAPAGNEITQCKASMQDLHEGVEMCLRGEGGACSRALAGLGESMVKRGEDLRDKVLGKAA